MENQNFQWENGKLTFLWPFSIAMFVYQRETQTSTNHPPAPLEAIILSAKSAAHAVAYAARKANVARVRGPW